MRYFVLGGAGFIGSHLVERIFSQEKDAEVTIYDNFSSGKKAFLSSVSGRIGFRLVIGDAKDPDKLKKAIHGAECVYHFASNPDIAKAMTDPGIDFREGTFLTHCLLEAMRETGVRRLLYASGSGVYGDRGEEALKEGAGNCFPISTYGASKLACEAMIASYCHLFDFSATAFRFANVVGPRQTHGVGYDWVRKLQKDPTRLQAMGNGSQLKSYLYVDDVVSAMRLVQSKVLKGFSVFNVAGDDRISVKEIAQLAMQVMDCANATVEWGQSERGWKGDVPKVVLNSDAIRQLGWKPTRSAREALRASLEALASELRKDNES